MVWRTWRAAMQHALYADGGFYRREVPTEHFATSVSTGAAFALAVRRLAGRVDEALGRPDPFDLVDLGAGRGELLAALPDVPSRWRLTAVDVAPPRAALRWRRQVPRLEGLLIANEFLDTVPLDVLRGRRLVEVAEDGSQRPGRPASPMDLAWAARWWPAAPQEWVELGWPRDRAWRQAVRRVRRGVAVAVDYGHLRDTRRPTLAGYRDGRQVPARPDGSCDLTAHVALDACAAATGATRHRQREALLRLGVDAGPPPAGTAGDDPRGYLERLAGAGAAGRLLDPGGLGGFGWLVQAVGVADPLAAGPATGRT